MEAKSILKQYRKRWKDLRAEQTDKSWLTTWKELRDFLAPRRGRYLDGVNPTEQNDGRKKGKKIINSTPRFAIRTLAAGLQGGMTSPSRPWFNLKTRDDTLSEVAGVRAWLHDTREKMLGVLAKSNFYGQVHTLYEELPVFGSGVMFIEEDLDTVIRCRTFTIGEFAILLDGSYRPRGLYRQFSYKTEQIMTEFSNKEDYSDLPIKVQEDIKNKRFDSTHEVVHVVEKNDKYTKGKIGPAGMEFKSCYFMATGTEEEKALLREGGYEELPFVAPRWNAMAGDVYGESPGMDALGDIKMLQKLEEKKLRALDKEIDPPMVAPASLRDKGATVIPGGVNFLDVAGGQQTFAPAYQIRVDIQKVQLEIAATERRIREFFFNDLFLSILNEDKKMTATEVARRFEEKLIVLGPVIERVQSESLDVIIDRVFGIMYRLGMFLEPPQELIEGTSGELIIEYTSTLAQAQKMVGLTGIDQLMAFVGSVLTVNPDAADKMDFDEAIDQYAMALGTPPKIVRSDEVVAQFRQQKQQMQQMQQAAQLAESASKSAKNLSDPNVAAMVQGTAAQVAPQQ